MKNILMVDDNTTNLKVAAAVLQPFYQLSMAKSGKQALSYLKKNRPDLILLDINMPEMNGYETLEEIKLNPELSNIPVIFLTAANDRESEVKALQKGALDFITKPFEEQVMLSRIEKVLQMEEMRMNFIDGQDSISDVENSGLLTTDVMSEKVDELILNNKICLIYADFDKFSIISSYYDENFKESFLNEFAYKLSEIFANGFIGKVGEDGFAIAFVINDDTDIEGYLRYVSEDCARHAYEKLGVREITCSAVATISGKHGNNYRELFYAADKGMYYVKKTADVSYIIYDGT